MTGLLPLSPSVLRDWEYFTGHSVTALEFAALLELDAVIRDPEPEKRDG